MTETEISVTGTTDNDISIPESFLNQDAASLRTRPLLRYLIELESQKAEKTTRNEVFKTILQKGKEPPPIPDESLELKDKLLALIKDGPKSTNPLPAGKTVSLSLCYIPPTWALTLVKVTIVGAGVSGLCAGYHLKKAGLNVRILEASSRVGGRVVTFRDPAFAPGLHGEGGAMRIPGDHYLLRQYITDFEIDKYMPFEMQNKFIYLSGYEGGKTMTYTEFNEKLQKKDPPDAGIAALFPGLKKDEKGRTCDELFLKAVDPVVKAFWKEYGPYKEPADPVKLKKAYEKITRLYDKYTLRSYLTEVAHWSQDAIALYDLGNAHVVFENGFIESFKDAFLSSNKQAASSGMEQLRNGMDLVPKAFIDPARGKDSVRDNITFGARVKHLEVHPDKVQQRQSPITVHYETLGGRQESVTSDYVIMAIPYTAQRSITKSRPFDPKQEMAIREVRYVEVTKVLLQYQTRWWEDVFFKAGQQHDGGVVCDLPIRYTMFPLTDEKNPQMANGNPRGVIMAAYTFQQDATILGALSPARRIQIAAENIDRIFPRANSSTLLEAGASQVFPADELAGGSAFCYFGPLQKSQYLEKMCESDWEERIFFAGEQASYTHGWIQGALEAGLRCVSQVYAAATTTVV